MTETAPVVPPPVAAAAKVEPKKEEPPPKPVETPAEPPAAAPEAVQKPPEEPKPEPRREAPVMAQIPRQQPRLITSVEIPVRSQPPGATVMLDNLPGTACVTPCVLKASSGEHTISLRRAGYQTVTRSINVTESTYELPVLTMAQALGILMVQTQPEGATIMVDDKRWPGVTPAQLSLPPGKYVLTLEKGALKAVQTIEIREGDLRRLATVLSQQ
jgi:PEGA domain